MNELVSLAREIGALLKERGETVAVAESSAGGLICAALLAVPGASAYFRGGAVAYTRAAREALLGLDARAAAAVAPATEACAALLADAVRRRLAATWALAETGTAGPSGSRYGHTPGHACFAVAGPVRRSATLDTGRAEREENMRDFANAALRLLEQALLEGSPASPLA